jgi:pyrimidine-nucleoside phosphorylase
MNTVDIIIRKRDGQALSREEIDHFVGNALETGEAVSVLRGQGPADLVEHCYTITERVVYLAGRAPSLQSAREMLKESLSSAQALKKLRA